MAERERMMDIFDNLPDPSAPSMPPPPPPPQTPEEAARPVHRYELVNVVKSTRDPGELPMRKTRYIGENDQWREFFNKKTGGGTGTSDPAPPPSEASAMPKK